MGLTSGLLDVVVELFERGIIFIDAFLNMVVGGESGSPRYIQPAKEPILVLSWPCSTDYSRGSGPLKVAWGRVPIPVGIF